MFFFSCAQCPQDNSDGTESVSYTHLDVYKRQGVSVFFDDLWKRRRKDRRKFFKNCFKEGISICSCDYSDDCWNYTDFPIFHLWKYNSDVSPVNSDVYDGSDKKLYAFYKASYFFVCYNGFWNVLRAHAVSDSFWDQPDYTENVLVYSHDIFRYHNISVTDIKSYLEIVLFVAKNV